MAVHAQHPCDLRRDLLLQIEQRTSELVEFLPSLGSQHRLSGIEEDLRLEHESIADNPDIRPIAKDLTEAPKKFGAIARQLLYPLSQRHVEPLAEIGDPRLRFLVFAFGGVEG